MRRIFYIFCGVLVFSIVGTAIFVAVLVHRSAALDEESRAYVDDAVVSVASHWSKDELLRRASSELKEKTDPAQLSALFDALARLGALVDYQGAKGQVSVAVMAGGSVVSASYMAKARFQKGEATFRLRMRKLGDHWVIDTFYVESPAVMNNLLGKPS